LTVPTATPSPRRTRARRGEGEKLREQILEAAERLLVRTGDEDAVSIRAVADAVGVTPPSIYLHFADKNELLFAVCEKHFSRFNEVLAEAQAAHPDPLDALFAMGRGYIRFGLENPEPYRIMFMGKAAALPRGFRQERIMTSAGFGYLVATVTRAIESGELEGDPLMVALGLWASVHGLTSLLISKPDFDWPDRQPLIEHLLQALITGLAPR